MKASYYMKFVYNASQFVFDYSAIYIISLLITFYFLLITALKLK